jgi:hypothetical protein
MMRKITVNLKADVTGEQGDDEPRARAETRIALDLESIINGANKYRIHLWKVENEGPIEIDESIDPSEVEQILLDHSIDVTISDSTIVECDNWPAAKIVLYCLE